MSWLSGSLSAVEGGEAVKMVVVVGGGVVVMFGDFWRHDCSEVMRDTHLIVWMLRVTIVKILC